MSKEDREPEVEGEDGDEANDEVPEMDAEDGPPKHEPFSVKVFSIAKAQQQSNGLRHNDHLRYRQYCTRRLRRLRNTLRWKNPRARGKQVPYPADFTDQRYLEFPLVNAERAWSYGVQLKSDNATSANWQPRWRLHSIRRLSKAVKWAEFLEQACKRHADQRTQREAEAYTSFMTGTLLLEKEAWEEALARFQRCKKVCEHLSLASDQAENKIFKEHAQSLAPQIRECKYNLGQAYEDDEAEAGTGPKSAKGKDMAEHKYRGHGLASPPEKIKAQLLKCLQLSNDLQVGTDEESGAVIDKYGQLSNEFADVLKDIHTDMISAGDTKEEGAEEGPSEEEYALVEAFARERSICMNVERNLVLMWNLLGKLDVLEELSSHKARNACRPEEGMRYCDLLKEDLESLLDMPKPSDSISQGLAAYVTVALNCRCFFLALCHSITGKTLESAALFDMLQRRFEDAVLSGALEEPLGRLHPLFERVIKSMPTRVTQWRCRSLALLCSKAPKLKDQEQDGSAEVTFPPRVRDIPCKPLLFDLAFPCIEAPDIEELLPKKGGDGDKKGILGRVAGGVGSRLSGFWNRGQK